MNLLETGCFFQLTARQSRASDEPLSSSSERKQSYEDLENDDGAARIGVFAVAVKTRLPQISQSSFPLRRV